MFNNFVLLTRRIPFNVNERQNFAKRKIIKILTNHQREKLKPESENYKPKNLIKMQSAQKKKKLKIVVIGETA